MAVTRPCYVGLDDVRRALDVRTSAYRRAQLERVICEASAAAEGLLGRSNFYPQVRTLKFDWPNAQIAPSWKLWLDGWYLVSVTTLTSGGVALTEGSDYILRPHEGPPYDNIEILLSGTKTFSADDTWQEQVVITGEVGYDDETLRVVELAETLDATETAISIAACSQLSAGNLIQVGTERMLVTSTSLADTAQVTGAALTASVGDDGVAVDDGTGFVTDELITIGTERMRVLDIAGNTLVVERAADGSVLAAHDASTAVYAARVLNVARGSAGTTAGVHGNDEGVHKQIYPPVLTALTLAEAINQLEQETSGYARTVGSGDNVRNASGAGIANLRARAIEALGVQARTAAI
jgi:hypothetical protein